MGKPEGMFELLNCFKKNEFKREKLATLLERLHDCFSVAEFISYARKNGNASDIVQIEKLLTTINK